MQVVPGDILDPQVGAGHSPPCSRRPNAGAHRRFAFYDRAKDDYAAVITGEVRKYGNILLKKGVTPPP
jgi:L-fucose mutarotase